MSADFFRDAHVELKRAELLHGENYASLHEAYAVLLEELDEIKAEVWRKSAERDPAHLYAELVQLAACCAKAARLVKPSESADPFLSGALAGMQDILTKGGSKP